MAEAESAMTQGAERDAGKPQEPRGSAFPKNVVLAVLVLVCVGAAISILLSIRNLDELISPTD